MKFLNKVKQFTGYNSDVNVFLLLNNGSPNSSSMDPSILDFSDRKFRSVFEVRSFLEPKLGLPAKEVSVDSSSSRVVEGFIVEWVDDNGIRCLERRSMLDLPSIAHKPKFREYLASHISTEIIMQDCLVYDRNKYSDEQVRSYIGAHRAAIGAACSNSLTMLI